MPIAIACECGAKLKVRDEAAGKKVRCPKCAAPISVPAPAPSGEKTGLRILEETPAAEKRCVYCGQKHPVDARVCPHCRHELRKPTPEEIKAEAPTGETVCPYCAEKIKSAAVRCRHCQADLRRPASSPDSGSAEEEQARDLSMESHLRAIALWWRIGAILCGIAGVLLLIAGCAAAGTRGIGTDAQTLSTVIAIVLFTAAIPCYLLGHFLARYSGAARYAAIAVTLLGMLGNIIQLVSAFSGPSSDGAAGSMFVAILSLVWSAAVLLLLFNGRAASVCSEEYKEVLYRSGGEDATATRSLFFWIPFLLIVLMGFAIFSGSYRPIPRNAPQDTTPRYHNYPSPRYR